MDEREIEAVAREIRDAPTARRRALRSWADRLDAALDRVRDARSDETPRLPTHHPDFRWPDGRKLGRPGREDPEAARSPQGEDHEAGIEAAARALTDCPGEWDEHEEGDKDVFRRMARDGIAAYLSRVSPSRDGTVGEDHEAATVEKIIALIESNHGAYLIEKHRPEDLSAFIRGQFPSPSTDDQTEGDAVTPAEREAAVDGVLEGVRARALRVLECRDDDGWPSPRTVAELRRDPCAMLRNTIPADDDAEDLELAAALLVAVAIVRPEGARGKPFAGRPAP